jgi:hypothetical protein
MRAEFVRDPLRPAKACTQDGTVGALDRRRWDGRTGVSCGKQWTKSKAACVKFHECVERIRRMELTWAPTKQDIARCAPALYNLGAGVTSRLYDVIRAKSYPVGRTSRHGNLPKHGSPQILGPPVLTRHVAWILGFGQEIWPLGGNALRFL